MGGRRTGTPKTGGRKAGTPNKRTVALRTATATAAEQISATLGSEVFHGDAHALLMTVYKDLKQPIGLRMEAAKAALPYEKPRPASIENKIVDEFENMSIEELEAWLDERAALTPRVRHRSHGVQRPRRQPAGAVGTPRPMTAQGKLTNIPTVGKGADGQRPKWGDDRGICDASGILGAALANAAATVSPAARPRQRPPCRARRQAAGPQRPRASSPGST